MSWESSLEYYRIINETVRDRLGGLHSAKCLMVSVDFAEIECFQREGRWEEAGAYLTEAAHQLERGGADFIVLCTNTMHKLAGELERQLHVPFLHIADPTAEQIITRGFTTVGLLGTRFTMEEDFYISRLIDKYHLHVLVPSATERAEVHRIIYEELVLGQVKPESRQTYVDVMERLVAQGAQGVILGCTEIGLLVHDADCRAPLFDTTRIHAVAAAQMALHD